MDERTQKLIETYKAQGPLTTKQIGDVFTATPINTPVVNSPITSDVLSNDERPITLPTLTPSTTTSAGYNAQTYSKADAIKADIDKEEQDYLAKAKERITGARSLAEKYLGLGTQTLEEKISAMQTPEFLEKKRASDTAYKALQANRQAQMAEIEALENESMLTDVQRSQRLNAINNKYAYKNAYLSMSYDIATKDYQSAQDQINTIVQLKQEAYKPYIDYYTRLAEDNQNLFNKAELEVLNNKRAEYERQRDQEINFEKTKGIAMMEAKEGGAPDSVIQAMSRATNNAELTMIGGQYIGALDRQAKLLQNRKLLAEISKAEGEASQGKKISELDFNSPTYFEDLLTATKGGKKPNQVETIRPIQKSIAVINQLADLQKAVEGSTTGPVIGTLKKMNPYDFDARAVQAILQATIPNLARGVYGEVGVLTDQDIKNYIQTLPNITSTKDQNDFVTAMTLKTVQRNLESQLETLASAGYDVSGFTNQYNKIKTQVSEIEDRLGIGKEPTDEELAKEFELMQQGATPEYVEQIPSFNGFFTNFNNQLFR